MGSQIIVPVLILPRGNNEYLVTRRRDEGRYANHLEFTGGKINHGEDPRICLEREVLEEIGILIKAKEVFDCSSYVNEKDKHIFLVAFYSELISGEREIQDIEVQHHYWMTPNEMMRQREEFCPADIPFVEKLNRNY